MRNHRERQKELPEALQSNEDVTPKEQSANIVTPDIDIRDKRLEIDIRDRY